MILFLNFTALLVMTERLLFHNFKYNVVLHFFYNISTYELYIKITTIYLLIIYISSVTYIYFLLFLFYFILIVLLSNR